MSDETGDGRGPGGGADLTTLREWARKTHLRETMRTESHSPDELKTLDARLARWKADQQMAGRLPPDWELQARRPELVKAFRGGREEARPILSQEEILEVEVSRNAAAVRDAIDRNASSSDAVREAGSRYGLLSGLGDLDARKRVTDRFDSMFGRTVSEYAAEHERRHAPEPGQTTKDRLFPKQFGWDEYEPAYRRLAEYEAKLFVNRANGLLTEKQYRQGMRSAELWADEQQRAGRLPTRAQESQAPQLARDVLLPFKKEFGRQERRRMEGENGAYWRRVDELAGHLKEDIVKDQRITDSLENYAVIHAPEYGRQVDQMKRDIEARFTLNYLDTPAEYLEDQLGRDKSRFAPRQISRESGRERDDGGRER